MKKKLPRLIITDELISIVIKKKIDTHTLIITDNYNYQSLITFCNVVLVTTCRERIIKSIKKKYKYSKIIAVGGCTVLDIARSSCYDSTELICFPTILSTTCLSCDRSKIEFSDGSRLLKTYYPKETIISLSSILTTKQSDLIKWTQSGFGDLFANISASIDFQYQNNNLKILDVKANVPDAFEALKWVLQKFKSYNKDCITQLANYLHQSSIDVIKRGNTELSAGGEHVLYHKIAERKRTQKDILATHGQIVGIGALISAKIFAEYTGHAELFIDLKTAYKKLLFPVTIREMEAIGLQRGYLQKMLIEMQSSKTLLGNYFSKNNFTILDTIFGT